MQTCVYDIFGPGVNLAAHGESYSSPMEITLCHDMHELIQDDFRLTETEAVEVEAGNEGGAEHFTREMTKVDRTGVYDVEIRLARRIAKEVGEEVLRKACFRGDAGVIKKISDFLTKPRGISRK